jgi:PPK2 family polyphosphate:nucleotide phosphotransferase
MKLKVGDFRVRPGAKVKLANWPTTIKPLYRSPKHCRKFIRHDLERLNALQERLYASGRHAILLIFQGLDAAGKDGAIRHVLAGVDPQGCEVHSFKTPSAEELAHDFLWRSTCRLPERGRIGIFNRSYYEETLIVRVHPELLQNERLPADQLNPRTIWAERQQSIVGLERHLHRNGTRVIKFFLHLSKAEQRRRFLERIDQPEKNWKLSAADLRERKFWPRYRRAYEESLSATSTAVAPWYIIPADDKDNARMIISRVIVEALQRLKLSYPRAGPARRRELKSIGRRLGGKSHAN